MNPDPDYVPIPMVTAHSLPGRRSAAGAPVGDAMLRGTDLPALVSMIEDLIAELERTGAIRPRRKR